MTSLLIDKLPDGMQRSQNLQADNCLGGIRRYDRDFLVHLLAYGSYDRYFVCNPHPLVREPSTLHDRLEFLHVDESEKLADLRSCILYRSGTDLSPYVPYRHYLGRPELPICGVSHGLSDIVDIPRYVLQSHLALHYYDAIVCTSPVAVGTLQRIYDQLAISGVLKGSIAAPTIEHPVIPIGVSCVNECDSLTREHARRSLEISADTFLAVSIGRLSPVNKGDLRPLIASLPALIAQLPNFRMLIAGDDTDYSLSSDLKEVISCAGLEAQVDILAPINDHNKHLLLAAADVFIAVSDTFTETFGISVAEALWHGIPVIANDWDGYRHLVKDHYNGFLIATRMCVDYLALSTLGALFDTRALQSMAVSVSYEQLHARLLQIATDPCFAKQLKTNALNDARGRYNWATVIQQYESFWQWQSECADFNKKSRRSDSRQAAFYVYDRTFIEHPSSFYTDEAIVQVTPDAQQCSLALERSQCLSVSFDAEIDAALIAFANTPVLLGELLATPILPWSRDRRLYHVLRLLKYGVLDLVRYE